MFKTLLVYGFPLFAVLWAVWCFICTAITGVLTLVLFGIALSCGFDAVRSDFSQQCGVILMLIVGIGFGTWSFLAVLAALGILSKKFK